ncbi:MAG: hypothetical protein H0V86_07005 [Chloroflexia bacterium]|nr:hypothetical protein [Chloroflexia bacterium]
MDSMSSERVTVREYPNTDDAKAAEELLLGSGLTSDIVSRSGKKIRVIANWEADAIAVLEGTLTTVDVMGGPVTAPVATDYYTEEGSTGVTDKAKGVTSTAADTVTGAASSATDTVSSAASTATDTVTQTASTAVDKVQDATSGVTTQIDKASNALADRIQTAAATVQEKGASPQSPAVQRTVAQTTANVLDKTAQYIEHPSGSVMLNDLRGAVRRHPLRSLLVGLGLGFLARSTVLSGVGSQGQGGQQSGQTGSSTDSTLDTATYGSSADLGYGAATTATMTDEYAMAGDVSATDMMDASAVTGDTTMSDATTLYADPVADVYADDTTLGATDTLAPDEEVLVVDVDPVTGEATSVMSTTLDSPEALGTDDPLNPRSGS